MRTPIVAGNWKLNGSRQSVLALASGIADGLGGETADVEVVVCPVAIHIAEVAKALEGTAVRLGAQNAYAENSGAFTGESAPTMLAEYGCSHVIVGHSERRSLFGESDDDCAQRCAAVNGAGLMALFCVGETLQERQAGNTMAVVERQLKALVDVAGADIFHSLVVAYEPVWAIGTGVSASPEQAQDVHAAIRRYVAGLNSVAAAKLRILYGGSVKGANAAELFAQTDIDGGLIGGAALQCDDFLAICRAASTL